MRAKQLKHNSVDKSKLHNLHQYVVEKLQQNQVQAVLQREVSTLPLFFLTRKEVEVRMI